MPALPNFPKRKQDPADRLDYGVNWQKPPKPFLQDGETITTSTWTLYTTAWVVASGPTLDDDTHTDTTSAVFVSDLVKGVTYFLTNHIVTSEGREKDESVTLICEEQ